MSPVVMWIAGTILLVAVLVALRRMEVGPSMLDRIAALDVVVAALIGASALWSAGTGRVDLVPLLTVMAIVGFVAAVALSRFAASEPEDEGRILTHEELAQVERARLARMDEQEPEG
ncbi:monovalent cation/H+ antiporter complex subunit F [Pseudactinotalea sp. Z1748]|uniref:monovalent cation/H+ antiporter complex subunit F n=1 Tax=Pseudactinotalea sp. Z1748 TaxID=3413027 RepID=UPI003C7CA2D4